MSASSDSAATADVARLTGELEAVTAERDQALQSGESGLQEAQAEAGRLRDELASGGEAEHSR